MPAPDELHPPVDVRGERVPVTVLGGGGAPAPRGDLLFLHGYARHPEDYGSLLEGLAAEGFRVVAPFLFANGSLRRPPRTFWACAALARRTVDALVATGQLAKGAPVVGHSTGGAVAMTLGARGEPAGAIVALNPVQPSGRPSPLFMLSSAWMNTKMALGLAGDGRRARAVLAESGGRFYVNWFRKPVAAYQLIGGLRAYTYGRLARWYRGRVPSGVRVRVVYGRGDEFYPRSEGLLPGLSGVFAAPEVVLLGAENSHEWMMFRPEYAVNEVLDVLLGAECDGRAEPSPISVRIRSYPGERVVLGVANG